MPIQNDTLEAVLQKETAALLRHDAKRFTQVQLILLQFTEHCQRCRCCRAFLQGNGLPLGVVCANGHAILINIFNV